MRSRILCIPPLRTIDEGLDLLTRLAFHLQYVEVERVTLLVDDDVLDAVTELNNAWGPWPDANPRMVEHHERIRDRINLVASSAADGAALGAETDYLVSWDSSGLEEWAELISTTEYQHRLVSTGGSAGDDLARIPLIRLASHINRRENADRNVSRQRFRSFVEHFAPVDRAFLIADMSHIPSDQSQAALIAYGTAALSTDFLSHEGPKIVVLFDPADHFGNSDPASQNRAALSPLASMPNSLIVTPDWAYALFTRLCPNLIHRVVGLPASMSVGPNTDLMTRFAIEPGGAVVTTMMLPIAAALATDIRVPTSEWGATNLDWERYAQSAEKTGRRLFVVGPADVAALRRRAVDLVSPPPSGAKSLRARYVLVSVNPDWVDDMGHHAHFDRAMRGATVDAGAVFTSLTSKALRPDDVTWQRPVFTHPSYGFDSIHPGVFLETFTDELVDALHRLVEEFPDTPLRVMMYSAGLAHLQGFITAALALDSHQISFFVNLLRSHADLLAVEDHPRLDHAEFLLREAINVGPSVGVHPMADSDELNDVIERIADTRLPIWPMVGVTPFDGIEDRLVESRSKQGPLTLCFPATQEVKGLRLFVDLAEDLASDTHSLELRLTARDVGSQAGIVARMRAAGVELTSGVLDPQDYARFMTNADIVALPYRRNPFQIQTSGVFADAVRLRIPMVATRGTWAGHLVDAYGLGTTFDEDDLGGFRQAVLATLTDYSRYVANMRDFASRWLKANNPAALLQAIESLATSQSLDFAAATNRFRLTSGVQTLGSTMAEREASTRRSTVAKLDDLVFELRETIEQRDNKVSSRDHSIDLLENRLAGMKADRDKQIARLETEIAKSAIRIETRDREISQHRTKLATIESVHDEKTRQMHTRINTRGETIAHLKLAVAELEEATSAIKESYEGRVATLKAGVAKRDATIAELNRTLRARVFRAVRRLRRG